MKKIRLLMLLITLLACEVYGKHDPSNYILINEIKTYGVTDFSDEFIELFNVSDSLFNIGNYRILYYNGDGSMRKLLYKFPDSTFIQPYRFYLLATEEYTEPKTPDAIMEHGLLSSGQLILVDGTYSDTLDAVAWGVVDSVETNEGVPAEYIYPVETPPVSPELGDDELLSIQRFPEGTDTNNNYADFKKRYFTSPMNSGDSLHMIVPESVQAIKAGESIVIRWETNSLTKNLVFSIYLKTPEDSDWTIIDPNEALKRQKIKDKHYFEYIHFLTELEEDYLCKIKELDFTDQSRFTSTVMVETDDSENPAQVVEVVSLEQNYPNPFNPVTTISFSVLEETHLKINIYNILGRHIKSLKEETFSAGDFKLRWDGTDDYGNKVPSGEYFIVLRTGDNVKVVRKMIVQK